MSFEDYPAADADGGAAQPASGGAGGGSGGSSGAAGAAAAAGSAGSGACMPGSVAWVEHFGNASNDEFTALAGHGSDVLASGTHRGASTLGKHLLPNEGLDDLFVAKLDAQGGVMWAKPFGSPGAETIADLAVDGVGNLVVTGTFAHASLDLGQGPLDYDAVTDVLVAKFEGVDGKTLWARGVPGAGAQTARAIAMDLPGDVFIAFELSEQMNIDGIGLNAGTDDIAVVKLAGSTGNRIWSLSFGDDRAQHVSSAATDELGAVYFGGHYEGEFPEFSLPVVDATLDGFDGFVARVNPNASAGWSVGFHGPDKQIVQALAASPSKLWAVGTFTTTVEATGGLSQTTNAQSAGFVAVIGFDGQVEALVALPGESALSDVAVRAGGGAYIAGAFKGTIVLGSTAITANDDWDWFVAEVGNDGKPLWGLAAGNDFANVAPKVASGGSNLVVGGGFEGQATIGDELVTTSGVDPLAIGLCP